VCPSVIIAILFVPCGVIEVHDEPDLVAEKVVKALHSPLLAAPRPFGLVIEMHKSKFAAL
jgi:hypothetical protein